MARWIEKPSQRQKTRYSHKFTFKDFPYKGFNFSSDKDGNVSEEDKKDLSECLNDERLEYNGLQEETWYVYSLGTIECHCGVTLELYSYWANSCTKCEREYDDSGGLLAPREFAARKRVEGRRHR